MITLLFVVDSGPVNVLLFVCVRANTHTHTHTMATLYVLEYRYGRT